LAALILSLAALAKIRNMGMMIAVADLKRDKSNNQITNTLSGFRKTPGICLKRG
jgi:hypothetical protein